MKKVGIIAAMQEELNEVIKDDDRYKRNTSL